MSYTYEYPRPMVTADVALVTKEKLNQKKNSKKILLIRRGNEPFAKKWALPGGFVEMEENLDDAALRELTEETSVVLEKNQIELLDVFGKPGRDPRGRLITIVYFAVVDEKFIKPIAGDDAEEVAWFDFDETLPELAFDHNEILSLLQKRLKN